MKIIVMKTLRMIGMAFVAVFLCMACSSDDEETKPNGPGGNKSEKKLVKLTEKGADIENSRYTFYYDSQKQVNRIMWEMSFYDGPYEFQTMQYVFWDRDSIKIVESGEYKDNDESVFYLEDGLVVSEPYEDKISYIYESDKKITYIGNQEANVTFLWNKNKLLDMVDSWHEEHNSLEYNDQTCKGYFPLYNTFWMWCLPEWYREANSKEIFYAHPELISLRNNNLPWRTNINNDILLWMYELDKDGYLKSCRLSNGIEYFFEWE